jgi:hypothetical protein
MKQVIDSSAKVLSYLGWVLIVVGVGVLIYWVIGWSSDPSDVNPVIFYGSGMLLLGITLLPVSGFVRYMFDARYSLGFMVRHMDLFLYLYGAFMVLETVLNWVYLLSFDGPLPPRFTISAILSTILNVGWACVLIGIGRISRILAPIIDDSRRLV